MKSNTWKNTFSSQKPIFWIKKIDYYNELVNKDVWITEKELRDKDLIEREEIELMRESALSVSRTLALVAEH